jgi:hypothetical protein
VAPGAGQADSDESYAPGARTASAEPCSGAQLPCSYSGEPARSTLTSSAASKPSSLPATTEDVHATDRHHLGLRRAGPLKNFQEQLTQARREIQRGLGKDEAKGLKGTRWLWQKSPENLTAQERQQLAQLKERFPRLKGLVEQRESLRAIFEDQGIRDAAAGAGRLRGWMEQA